MENEQVFEADAELHGIEYMRSRSSHATAQKSRSPVKATFHGIEIEANSPSEESPLLPPDHRDGGSGEASEDGDAPAKWNGERDFEGLPWWKKPSMLWLLPAYGVFALAFGGTVVPRIDLFTSLICERYFCERSLQDPNFIMMPVLLGGDNPQCRIPEVQSRVSKFTLYLNLATGLLSAIVSPKLGALSDRYGRVWMIFVTVLGSVLCEVVIIVVATNPDTLSVNWLFLGFIFDGLGGSFIAAMALSFSYASDCTPPNRRNVIFGYFQGSLFAGIAAGPIIAGYITQATGQLLTIFYISLGVHSAFLLFLFIVPESLSKKRQIRAREKSRLAGVGEQQTYWSRLFSNDALQLFTGMKLLEPLAILWPTGEGTSPAVRRNLALLAAVDTTMFGVAMGSLTVVIIYVKYVFGWDTLQSSAFVSIANTCRVFTLVVVLPLLTRILRGPRSKDDQRSSGCDNIDLGIIRFAIFIDVLGYVGYSTVRTGNLFILCGAVAAIGGMGSPSLQAALTKHVPPDRVGQVLGAMGLLHASARIVAPTLFNLIYAETVGDFPQTVFVCLAATFGVAFILSWFIRPHVYWDQEDHSHGNDANDGVTGEDSSQRND